MLYTFDKLLSLQEKNFKKRIIPKQQTTDKDKSKISSVH